MRLPGPASQAHTGWANRIPSGRGNDVRGDPGCRRSRCRGGDGNAGRLGACPYEARPRRPGSPTHRARRLAGRAPPFSTCGTCRAVGGPNAFYSAAAQAGAENWTAMLFGSSDAGNAITVDKTPAALWVIDISVRLFGLSSWSVLVPQALMGVGAVAVLYAAVRRAAGPWCGSAGRRGTGADAGGRVDLPVQQSRRTPGAAARHGGVLRSARESKRMPAVGGSSPGEPRSASGSWPRCCRRSWCCPPSPGRP